MSDRLQKPHEPAGWAQGWYSDVETCRSGMSAAIGAINAGHFERAKKILADTLEAVPELDYEGSET